MLDVNFYIKSHKLNQKLMNGSSFDKSYVFSEFEKFRNIVLLLASERSSYITGQCIVVDGGWTAW